MMCRPRLRSRKRVGSSGGSPELASDRFFDFRISALIVPRQVVDRFTRLVALGDHLRGESGCPSENYVDGKLQSIPCHVRITDDALETVEHPGA